AALMSLDHTTTTQFAALYFKEANVVKSYIGKWGSAYATADLQNDVQISNLVSGSGDINFNVNNDQVNPAMRLTWDGKLGIGTSAPSTKLDVSGTVTATAFVGDGSALTGIPGDNLGNHSVTQNLLPSVDNTRDLGSTSFYFKDFYFKGNIRSNGNVFIKQPTNNSTFVGDGAGLSTTGANNTLIGRLAGTATTTGSSNTALGYRALATNTTSSNNTALGSQALESVNGGLQNTAIGAQAIGSLTSGHDNIGVGYQSLFANLAGSDNVAVGREALDLTTSSNNVAMGRNAGDFNTTGNSNTFIGYNADATVATLTNATAIGANASVSQSNSLILGNGVNVGIGTTTPAYPLDVVGDARVGWHGSSDTIFILPSEFQIDNDAGIANGNLITFNEDANPRGISVNCPSGCPDLVATVPIPTGYMATHTKIYGNAASAIIVYEADISTGNWSQLGATGNVNTEFDHPNATNGNGLKYLTILVNVGATGDKYYGGYVLIAPK
ncbi:MAG: hypothetical protein JKY42_12350, partial [Flavobacteriales bacterium]|nr:hypothetical protein [Flavobacteriales bacterium]